MNKDYYLIQSYGNYAKEKCERCGNKPIGCFRILHFIVLKEDDPFETYPEIKDLCENCYKLLKENERVPPSLEPIYSFERKDPNECIKELEKYPNLSLTKIIIDLVKPQDQQISYDELLERLKKRSANDRADLIYDFLSEKLFDFNIFEKLLYIDLGNKDFEENFYFLRYGKLIQAKEIIRNLLMKLFKEIVTTHVQREFFLKLLKKAIYISRAEYNQKINPIKYLKFKNAILDTINFEIVNDLDAYFTYEIPWDLDLEFFEKLRKGLIDESYFQNCLFYHTLRRFYDDENWNKLILALGSVICYGLNEKRRIFLIIGEPNTGKSTLMTLLLRTFGDFAIAISHLHFKESYNFAFSFLMYGKKIAFLGERPDLSISNVETLKKVTGDIMIEVQDKHKRAIQVNAMLRIFIFANNEPYFDEYDEAFVSRLFIIDTQNPLEKIDPYLMNELLKEENIKDFLKFLLWCAYQYWKRGFLVENDAEYNDYIMKRLKESRDFLKPFIEECCIIGDEYREKRNILYSAFLEFRKENGLPLNISDKAFYRAMRVKFEEIKGKDGNWYFKRLRLKEEYKEQSSLS